MKTVFGLFLVLIFTSAATVAVMAQQVFAYPSAGQAVEQQSMDRYECHTWAVQQTGFDPSGLPPHQMQAAPIQTVQVAKGGGAGEALVSGAVEGAATGALVGVISGDKVGGTAAAGAAVGALKGLFKDSRRKSKNRAQAQQQRSAAQVQVAHLGRENYNRAWGACMTARDYTVQ